MRLAVALLSLIATVTQSQAAQSIPQSPVVWREVTAVTNLWVGTNATPMFTRPHVPAFRTTMDGRIALVVEGGGVEGGTPRFTLLMPEKMNQPFLKMPASSYTMSATNAFKIIDGMSSGQNPTNYTLGGRGVSHACMWDDAGPTVNANNEDVYQIKVVVSSNSGSSPTNRTAFFVTPIQVVVTNAKTATASIRSITKTGPTTGTAVFTNFVGSAFEPAVVGDGRLLVVRVGSGSLPWKNPNTGTNMPPQACDIVYAYYTNGVTADASQWTNLIPITYAPYDNRINSKFGFAMAPFRDGEGRIIPGGEDIGGSYPWMDRGAKNLFFEAVFDQLAYSTNGLTNWISGRYPFTAAPEEAADVSQGEDGGKHQGVSFVGLWSHGKVVILDNLNNEIDYAIGQGDSRSDGGTPSTGPQQRMVSLFQPNSGPLGNENGYLRMGYGRSTKKMPRGENDNANIIDSIENRFNYNKNAFPMSLRDVAWIVSDSGTADELSFDDYLDPDAFIIANMAGLLTFPTTATNTSGGNSMTHHSGWNKTTKLFDQPVKLQNAATPQTNRWKVPVHGLVKGNGRLEPAATGGVHGKGFWMDGNIGLEFPIVAQPQNVTNKNWYVGMYVDCRFGNDTTNRLLMSFPDGTAIFLYGRSQVLYTAANGEVLNRITIPVVSTNLPATTIDDLLPQMDWAHLAFQVSKSGSQVDFYLNGIIFNRWNDEYAALFRMSVGNLTIGKNTNGILNAYTGFTGWTDDFKVIAHAVDPETACNHAGGTLIGLPSTYTNLWKTKFADRYPTWAHDEISAFLKNNGETNYPKYANYYDYTADNMVHRGNIPAGTVSLRQSVHFPEGPLFHNAPRPHSEMNKFCITCHTSDSDPGLDLTALTLDAAVQAKNDPRRQPMQPMALIHGRIPAGTITTTTVPQPTATTNTAAGGKLIDEWMLPTFSNNVVVRSFSLVDAVTQLDLITLTNNGVVDPYRLGTTNFTIRANLDWAQGSVTMQYDAWTPKLMARPPYTVFGTTNSPYLGTNLTIGAHTIRATPQFGTLSNISFTVTGNVTRVVAGYRDDFRPVSPAAGWSYEWNAMGSISNRVNYRYQHWSPVVNKYSVNGFPVSPDNSSTLFPYGSLGSTGGHPGRGTTQAATHDRFAIAAYTAKLGGYYGLTNAFVTGSSTNGNGGQVIIFTDTNGGATFTKVFDQNYAAGTTINFNGNIGYLQKGDTVYVGVGPNTSDGNDSFSIDFRIVVKETGNPF